MAFNEKLQKVLGEAQGIKPFNYDSVFKKNNVLKKQYTLLQVKLKALAMEEKDVDLWWDVLQDIVLKDIGKVCRMYERNEKLYMHRIFQLEKVIPSFQCEPFVFILEPKTLDEQEERRNTYGVRPSNIRIEEEELAYLKGGRDSFEREALVV